MTTAGALLHPTEPHPQINFDPAPNAFRIRWRAPATGDRYEIASDWFEVRDILHRVGQPGWEYLVVEPDPPAREPRWAQCLGRPEAMSVEYARWNPRLNQVDLFRLGRRGAQNPLVDIHADPRVSEMVRPCQVLTAADAIIVFHDWLVRRHTCGFTREHFPHSPLEFFSTSSTAESKERGPRA